MIKKIKKLVMKLTRNQVACSPSLIQMFEETKRWFLERVKVHFAASQKCYLQWRWCTAEKMFMHFKDGRALTIVAPALPTNKRKQRKRIKIAKPSDLTVIPE